MLILVALIFGVGIGFVVGRVWEIRQAMLTVSRYAAQVAPAAHAHQPPGPNDLLAANEPPMGF